MLSGWGKVSIAGETALIGIDCFDSNNKKIPGGKNTISFDKTNYEKKSTRFTAAAGTSKMQIYVYKNGDPQNPSPGYAYLDDLSIKPAVNLVKNADFQIFDELSPTTVSGWENWNPDNSVVTTIDGQGCDNSVAVRIGPALKDGAGMGQIVDYIPEKATYTLSGFGMVSTTTEAAILGVDCIDDSNNKIANGRITIEFTGTEFEQKSKTFTTAAGTKKLQIYLYKNEGSGYAYIDNVSIYSEDVNLVRNSDFEICKGTTESAIFGWERDLDADSGHSGVTKIDAGSGCDGSNSIRIGSGEGGRGQIINNITENTSFILSGWGKVSVTGTTVYFGVDCLDSVEKKIPGGKFGLEFSGDNYRNLTKAFTTKPGTAKLQVYVYKDGPGEEGKIEYGYIDNISLVQTSSSPVVDKPLKNLDFEIFNETSPAIIDGWDNWGNTVIVNGEGCDKSHAAKIGAAGVKDAEGGAGQIIDNASAGSTYKATGWGKTSIQGAADAAIIGVDCKDKDNNNIAGGKFSIEFTETEYAMKSFTFKAPEGTKKIQLYIYKNPGEGFAYLIISLLKNWSRKLIQ